MKKLQYRLGKENVLTLSQQNNIKGGKRLITTNYQEFCTKRDQLQASGTTIRGITHTGNRYCLEW